MGDPLKPNNSIAKPSKVRVVQRRDFLLAGAAGMAISAMGAGETFARTSKMKPGAEHPETDQDREFMRQAIELMRRAGVIDKTGGPFGAVIVRNGEVLAASGNSVLRDNDPSAHAEVNAIRMACKEVGSPHIDGAVMYTSCECCPMCYATAYWARISKVYYAASWKDYADLFDDSAIGTDMAKPYPQRKLAPQQIMEREAQKVWLEFRKMPDRARY